MSEQIASKLHAMGFSIESEFIPFSRSRNKNEKDPSLNWFITLKYNDRDVLTTDYMQGMAHCPAYTRNWKGLAYRNSRIKDAAIKHECQTGIIARQFGDNIRGTNKPVPPPTIDEVLYCIVSDADVLNYASFEDWAHEFGFDADSRSAEKTYKQCLESALTLRNMLGDDKLEKLREMLADY